MEEAQTVSRRQRGLEFSPEKPDGMLGEFRPDRFAQL